MNLKNLRKSRLAWLLGWFFVAWHPYAAAQVHPNVHPSSGSGGLLLSNTWSGTNLFTSTVTFGSAADAANAVTTNATAGCIKFEGATADAHEAILCATDPTVGDATFNIPNGAAASTFTVAALELAQTWTAMQTFGANIFLSNQRNFNVGTDGFFGFRFSTTNTPDQPRMFVPDTGGGSSRNVDIVDAGDAAGVDYGSPCENSGQCAAPTVTWRSAATTQTNYQMRSYWGEAGKAVKALVAATPTAVFRIPVAAATGTGGQLYYTVFASDGTDHQSRTGQVAVAVVNKAGTETCVLGTPVESVAPSAGTLTVTIACDTTPTNAVDITFDAASSLTETTLDAYTSIKLVGPGEPTPQ